jgi:methionine-rich copper-binding protein CopC
MAAIVGLSLTGPAFAHAHLKSATPAEGGTVAASPSELDLTFSEGVNLKFSGLKVIGPDKAAVPTGDTTLTNGDTTLIVPISGTLATGIYTVEWYALSADGHKTDGSYTFTVKP